MFIMKYLRKFLDLVFYIIHPLFRSESLQRFLRQYIALPYSMAKHLNYTGLVEFWVNGVKLVMRSYNTPIEMTIFWRGAFKAREGSELYLWSRLILDADVVLDVGANNGVYTLIAATNQKAKVYAFEPVPLVYKMLEENIDLNQMHNIVPKKEIIGDVTGTSTLFVPKEGWVDVASLEKGFAEKFNENKKMEEINCPSITVDDLLMREQIKKTDKIVCKIDVEGAEHRVVKGMQNILNEGNVVILAELLTEDDFVRVRKMVPTEYSAFGVDLTSKRLKFCDSHIKAANNFLFIRTDHPLLLDGLKL